MARDLTVLTAWQDTRFLMDKKGVQLKSEVVMTFGCSVCVEPPPTHLMVFDKPFLVLMSRQGSKAPYFALWIGNADMLVKAA